MKLFTARPPSTQPANPPMFLGIVGWCKGQAGMRNGQPDPYRATILDIGQIDPSGTSAIIGGSPGNATINLPGLADGDRVSILWKTSYSGNYWKYDLGRVDMVYNAGSGKLLDDEYTMGQDWTFHDDAHNLDQRPEGGQVFAYVNCQVRDILVYWMIDPKLTPGCPVIVFQEPTTQIVSDNNLDPVMVRYNGYAAIDDYYWEWVEYSQIFPS